MSADGDQLSLFGAESRPDEVSRPGRSLQAVGLFAGIGGIELGLAKSGHQTSMLVENEPGARAVLSHRFPGAHLHEDVRDLSGLPGGVDLLAGGFPCQDLSQAGPTAGIRGTRSGLVDEVFRLARSHDVPWLLLENVPFMLRLNGGEALELIVGTLESLGYAWTYRVVDSRCFGLPQRRERVYLLASREGDPRDVLLADDAGPPTLTPASDWRAVACGFYWTEGLRGLGWAHDAVPTLKGGSTIGIPSPPAIVMPSGKIVKPDIRDAERLQGFAVDWTRPAEAVQRQGHRWKLVGNAVTVDAAAWIGRRLRNPGRYDPSGDQPLLRHGAWPKAAWGDGIDGRHASDATAWPERRPSQSLEQFLSFPTVPLSVRALNGFYARTRRAKLRFPPGFLDVVQENLGSS
jgi:DNA (cytosine-5)-methyltransferase 1